MGVTSSGMCSGGRPPGLHRSGVVPGITWHGIGLFSGNDFTPGGIHVGPRVSREPGVPGVWPLVGVPPCLRPSLPAHSAVPHRSPLPTTRAQTLTPRGLPGSSCSGSPALEPGTPATDSGSSPAPVPPGGTDVRTAPGPAAQGLPPVAFLPVTACSGQRLPGPHSDATTPLLSSPRGPETPWSSACPCTARLPRGFFFIPRHGCVTRSSWKSIGSPPGSVRTTGRREPADPVPSPSSSRPMLGFSFTLLRARGCRVSHLQVPDTGSQNQSAVPPIAFSSVKTPVHSIVKIRSSQENEIRIFSFAKMM